MNVKRLVNILSTSVVEKQESFAVLVLLSFFQDFLWVFHGFALVLLWFCELLVIFCSLGSYLTTFWGRFLKITSRLLFGNFKLVGPETRPKKTGRYQ